LSKWGHRVTVASNGVEAVAAWEKNRFDLILMDVQMPEMDGYQATAVIRAREATQGGHIPIVAMTAHAMKGDREECLEAGMDGYVSKPIRIKELKTAIEEVVGPLAAGASNDNRNKPAAVQPVNWETVGQMISGGPERIHKILTMLLEDCPARLDELDQAVRIGDSATVQRSAHTIKGDLRILGESPAAQLAERLEQLGRVGDCRQAADLLPALRQETEGILVQVKDYVELEK
jgi:CheY-like chemotaxis protein